METTLLNLLRSSFRFVGFFFVTVNLTFFLFFFYQWDPRICGVCVCVTFWFVVLLDFFWLFLFWKLFLVDDWKNDSTIDSTVTIGEYKCVLDTALPCAERGHAPQPGRGKVGVHSFFFVFRVGGRQRAKVLSITNEGVLLEVTADVDCFLPCDSSLFWSWAIFLSMSGERFSLVGVFQPVLAASVRCLVPRNQRRRVKKSDTLQKKVKDVRIKFTL